MVFASHAYPSKFSAGNIGVDIFFVLSGFVITRLLLAHRATEGKWGLATFYKNRFLRLTPALWLMVLCISAALPFFGRSKDLALVPWTLFYSMDFFQIITPDTARVFLHTWSLSVEEQFYLVWPLMLVVVSLGSRSVRRVKILALLGAFCSLAMTAALTLEKSGAGAASRIYNGPDTRAVQLFVGCALACIDPDKVPAAVKRLLGVVAWVVALVLAAWVAFLPSDDANFRLFVVLPFIAVATGSVIFVLSTNGTHLLTRLLSHPALSWPGRHLSYSFYLWHYPLVVMVEPLLPGHARYQVVQVFILSCACSLFSFVAVERPIARKFR